MGKITVKHYLNTNLKPYVIRSENYYSMYVMVVVNRKNTKVKSISFEELYTENDFEEIQSDSDGLLIQEIAVIEKLCSLIQDVLGDFDTTFFSAYYSLMKDIFIDSIDFEKHARNKFNIWDEMHKNNKMNLAIESFVFGDFSLGINKTHGMDMFTWYSLTGQEKLCNYLKEKNIQGDISQITLMLNKLVFLGSMEAFSMKLHESKKGKELYKKYSETIDNDYGRYFEVVQEEYKNIG